VATMAAIRARLPAGFEDAIALFLTMRVALGLVVIYLWWRGGVPGPCHFELARNGWLTVPPLADEGVGLPLVGVWQRWDACWYGKIATFWYEPQELSVNFWPLFPLLTGFISPLVGGGVALAGLVVSGIAYVFAMVGLYRLVARDVDPVTARRTIVVLSIFPSAFFLFAPFTEALFLALAVWTMVAARERRWVLAGAVGLLAALTRIQGVFLIFPVGWEVAVAAGLTAWRPWRSLALPAIDWGVIGRGLIAVGGPALGFWSFIGYTAATVGQTPLDTQDAWGGKEFFPPWEVVDAAWTWAIERSDPLQAFNLILLIGFGVLLVVAARRLPISYTLYALPQFLLLATRIQPTPLTSTNRYLLVIFPVFVVLALIPWARVRLAWGITSILFLALLLTEFQRGTFVA
jgi:hypothetical protein